MNPTAPPLTVYLLPGLDGTGRLYRWLVAELLPDFDVRILDYPNDKFDGYPNLAESIALRLPRDKPFLLVSESFAGPLSVFVASEQPEGLRGLVIAASFLRSPVSQSSTISRLVNYLPLSIRPPLSMLETVLMGGWKDKVVRQELEASLHSVAPQVLKSRLIAAMTVDVRSEFDRIGVPMLYLRASRDRLLRNGVCKDFRSATNPPKQVDLSGPHFLFQAVASEAAQNIRKFISENRISSR